MLYCRKAETARKRRSCSWEATGDVVSVYVSLCCLDPLTTTLFFAVWSLLMSYRWWHLKARLRISSVISVWARRSQVSNSRKPSRSLSSALNHCGWGWFPAFLKLVGLVELGGSLRSYVVITLKDSSASVLIYPFRVGLIVLIACLSVVWWHHALTSLTDEYSSSPFALLI